MTEGPQIAAMVLRSAAAPLDVLSIGRTEPFTTCSPVFEVRRAYIRLAAQIHPDKIGREFSDATRAFQTVVRSFDQFCSGEIKTKPVRKPAKKAPAREPVVKLSRTENKKATPETAVAVAPTPSERVGTGCFITPMACPNCKTFWKPDTPKQFTLVMAFNAKIHCEVCVLAYGWATAHHYCPLCRRGLEFDRDQYDSEISCTHCRKGFWYARHSIDDRMVAEMAERREQEQTERAAREQRDARAADRAGTKDDDMDLKVGECIVEERCPLCRKTVKSKHRDHVQRCVANGVRPAPPPPTVIVGERRAAKPAKAAAKAPKTVCPKPARAAAPASTRNSALANKKAAMPNQKPKRTRAQPDEPDSSDWGSDGTD